MIQLIDLVDDVLNGTLGPEDFVNVELLKDINDTLRKIANGENLEISGVKIAKLRKALIDRINQLTTINVDEQEPE